MHALQQGAQSSIIECGESLGKSFSWLPWNYTAFDIQYRQRTPGHATPWFISNAMHAQPRQNQRHVQSKYAPEMKLALRRAKVRLQIREYAI
jgi:hypothetical protein